MKNIFPYLIVGVAVYLVLTKTNLLKKSPTTDTPGTNPGNTSIYGSKLQKRYLPQHINV